jgi:hypothetical protein
MLCNLSNFHHKRKMYEERKPNNYVSLVIFAIIKDKHFKFNMILFCPLLYKKETKFESHFKID